MKLTAFIFRNSSPSYSLSCMYKIHDSVLNDVIATVSKRINAMKVFISLIQESRLNKMGSAS